MKRTVVPAGAGDERSAERFREEKSPTTLLAGRRHVCISFAFFFYFVLPLSEKKKNFRAL